MQRNPYEHDEHDGLMSEINMTPMVDVMLVLLIIFIITMPIISHSVKINLPHASTQVHETQPNHIRLSINAQGTIFWNDQATEINQLKQLAQTANQTPNTQIQLRAEKSTQYQIITHVMAEIQNAGIHKIALITTPN